jgi:hypothetical protein
MKNLKKYDKFNEELNYDTYMSAAKQLGQLGHHKRADKLAKHASDMERRNVDETDNEYTWFDGNQVSLQDIAIKHNSAQIIQFRLTFKYKRYSNSETIDFIYFRQDDKLIYDISEDELGDGIDHLFSNRPDALKFKKKFAAWMQENNFANVIPALERLSVNILYKEIKKHKFNKYNYDDNEDF